MMSLEQHVTAFSTLPARQLPGLLSRKVLCTLRSWASRNKEPRLLSSRNSRTHTCNRERYAAALAMGNSALACEDQTKV